MTPTTSIEGEATFSDAMRLANYAEKALVLCVGNGKAEEPTAFLVITQELLELWQKKLEGERDGKV